MSAGGGAGSVSVRAAVTARPPLAAAAAAALLWPRPPRLPSRSALTSLLPLPLSPPVAVRAWIRRPDLTDRADSFPWATTNSDNNSGERQQRRQRQEPSGDHGDQRRGAVHDVLLQQRLE